MSEIEKYVFLYKTDENKSHSYYPSSSYRGRCE